MKLGILKYEQGTTPLSVWICRSCMKHHFSTKSISPYYFKLTSALRPRCVVLILARQCVCLFSATCYHRHATMLTLQWQGCNSLVDKPRLTVSQYMYILNISYIGHFVFKTETNNTRMLTNYTWRHYKTLRSRIRLKAHAHTVSHTLTSNSYSAVNCHNVFLGNCAFLGAKHFFQVLFKPANNYKYLQTTI